VTQRTAEETLKATEISKSYPRQCGKSHHRIIFPIIRLFGGCAKLCDGFTSGPWSKKARHFGGPFCL